MGSRASLNKVLLIGNLTRDPELRYTPSGAAVCSFGIATNRFYVASDGTKKEETEFMRIVAWNKLGELCSQLLTKGRKVYVEGRLQTRSWETPDGQPRQTTEVVIDDMRILDSRRDFAEAGTTVAEAVGRDTAVDELTVEEGVQTKTVGPAAEVKKTTKVTKSQKAVEEPADDDKVDLDDLPF